MHRTSWSYVLEAKPAGRSISWLGYDSPHGTAYLPFFGAATEGAPKSFHSHEGYMSKFSTRVAWWAFNVVNQYSDLNFELINKFVRVMATQVEVEGQKQIGKCEAIADENTDELAAADALTLCSNTFAEEKVAEWWDLAFSLFAKFGRYAITSNETEQGEVVQSYPTWWLQSAEVGYTNWSPSGNSPGTSDVEPLFSVRAFTALMAVVVVAGNVAVAALAHQWGVHQGEQQAKTEDVYMYLPA